MKRIHYAGLAFSTSDELSDELVAYAAELARHQTADTVDVPSISDTGFRESIVMLLGPASQLVVDHSEVPDSVDTDAVVDDVRARRHRLADPDPGIHMSPAVNGDEPQGPQAWGSSYFDDLL